MPRILIAAIVLFLGTPMSPAATWVVLADGTGDAPTIQSAVSQAASGDVIQIGPGTYYEDIFITGKDLILESQAGYASTILDGSYEDSSVVVLVDDALHTVTIRGFTIANGSGTTPPGSTPRGGGIYGLGYIEITIAECRITANTAEFGGGGLISKNSDLPFFNIPRVKLHNNIIEYNESIKNGGGFYLTGTESEVRGNVFRLNYSPFDAGGLNITGNVGSLVVAENVFLQNEALDKGGAIQTIFHSWATGPIIEFNLFYDNKASGQDGPDIGTGAAILLDTEVGGTVRNNTIVFNDGTGSTGCSGGAFTFFSMNSPLMISGNIIANNLGCGMSCYALSDPSQIIMGENLFWQNSGGDISSTLDPCPAEWESTIVTADPLFCGPDVDDFSVRDDSPALVGPALFGAFLDPGCSAPTPAERVSWGDIKARYHEGRGGTEGP